MALTQGDIAFISFNADEDGWSIVTFVDIDPNTIIYFTDNEATSLTAFNTGESYFQWNSGANTITAGTVIRFSAIDNATNLAASIGTFSRVSVSGSSNYGLSASGDTVYAYLGTNANSPTVFLSGISNDTNTQGTTDLTAAGLTIGTNSILLNSSADYGVYNGARSGESSFANYKLLVNNVSNWTVDTVNGDYTTTVPNTTNFAIASGNPTVNLSVSTNSGTEAGTTQITVTATASSAVSGNQTVSLGVTGTGITAADYNLSNTAIAILDGQTAGSITFTVVDDTVIEGTETATLTISNPSPGISLGSTTTQNITITDNDVVVGQAPTIQLDTASTTDLLDANGVSTTGTGAISGVIGNANDPAKTLGVNFTIADSDTPVENLTVTVTSSNAAVVPNGNLTLTGTGVSRNLKINPVGVGNANITVSVSDGASTANYAIAYAASANDGTATTQFLTGTSDASTAIPVGGTFFLEADDENQVLHLYDSSKSGLPVTGFDFTSSLGLTQTDGSGVLREVDLEASTKVGDAYGGKLRIFWLGSQSNSDDGKNRPNRDRIFATDITGTGASTTLSYVGRYDFLKEDIINWDVNNGHGKGANYYGLAASAATNVGSKQSNGYNIEGLEIAPDNTTAYIAFRAPQVPPSGRSNALIVPVTNFASLISASSGGTKGSAQFGAPIELDLGGRGIREIRKNANNQYVIIAGPAGDAGAAPNDFRLYTWDGNPNSAPQLRAATFPASFNPEGIITIPDNLTNTSQIQFVSDDGNSVLYNDGTAAKDLSENNFKKFRTDSITLGAVVLTPRIHDIQGASHISPLNGQKVADVAGIVTVIKSNGFYLQDPNPDSDDRTSEGIFVFTSSAPTVQVGDSVLVGGTVSEFRPGGATSANLTTTEIISPTIAKLSSGNALPTATILGNGGRTIPTSVIDNDTTGNIETGTTTFDPAQDGIDFYESLEAMRVQINNPVAVSPTNSFGEIWLLADNGANATGRTARGGVVISPNDFNPERIQIDDTLFTSGSSPQVNVGATFSTITGVVDYSFSNYEVLPTSVSVTSNTLTKEVTNLTPTTDQLTVATFNVENLDPGDGATKFNNLASRIVNNLKSPDIISLEEIQDNNGPTNDSVVDASVTFQTLINAIAAAGGPTYQYRQINPVDDTNGGEPGGNIRVGFLFNPNRVSFVDRPGGTSTSNTTVTNVSGVPTVSNSPGLIDPTNSAFTSSRKPLVGEFTFNGRTVYIIGNHFNSKGGDQPLYGPNQPPTLTSEVQRQQQATVVKNFVQSILAINPNANVVVAGDLNDFEFSNPVSILESAGLTSLIETLPANERYTYNFEGNAQTLDHVLVSKNLLSKLDGYDVVHINSEFADQDSDHDPSLARFNLAANNAPTVVQPIDDQIISTNKAFSFNVSNKFTDVDQGDTLSYSATGLPTGSSIVANTGVISGTVSQTGIFAVTVTAADGNGGNVSDTFDLTVANNKATSGNDIIFVSELTGLNKYIVNALAGSDRVIGTNTSELIDGGSGNDYLDGKGGIDVLLGGDGNDTILGGLGSDALSGGNDNDRLIGWGGGTNEIDLLNGEQGADTYVLGDATSVFYTRSRNTDYADILNFQASDRIQLKGVANNYSLGSVKSDVGIFTNNGTELIAVVENGLNRNTNLATDTRFVFV
ncbi:MULTISPECIES: putative Ig domain-containing protein [unclassified Nostoc]|uniref:putative Ig domain-containing protein n=1 Tax=unclassified Nostoc TaxID=2593658 RepID=UPI002AD56C1F|nr:putative Ig domain-containing protein [Nostoc sp. DedQUE03]MDZ7976388.1 putative Ig domain-containing protein [Nostoc sp. DedQUE03]MDZ8048002.1 putative Ig domain-containing protein [Nostoc sp. DedQUE02]